MGFNLGLLGMAYRGWRDADKRDRDEQFLEAQRAYQQRNMEEHDTLRPDRIEAARGKYKLENARTAGELERMPLQNQYEKTELEHKVGEQPGLHDTEREKNRAARVRAHTDAKMADVEADLLPDKIRKAVIEGTMSVEDAQTHALGAFADRLRARNDTAALRLLNNLASKTEILDLPKGTTFGKVKQVPVMLDNGEKSWVARLYDNNGNPLGDVPKEYLATANEFYKRTSDQKGQENIKLGEGDRLVNSRTGKEIARNPKVEKPEKPAPVPADIQWEQYMTGTHPTVKNPKPITHEEARNLKRNNVAREEFMEKRRAADYEYSMGMLSEEEMIERERIWDAQYDRMTRGKSGASNSSGTPTIPQKVIDLFNGR